MLALLSDVHACHVYVSNCAHIVDLVEFYVACNTRVRICLYVWHSLSARSMFTNSEMVLECWGKKNFTTFSNGSLGSRIDEERSEMR